MATSMELCVHQLREDNPHFVLPLWIDEINKCMNPLVQYISTAIPIQVLEYGQAHYHGHTEEQIYIFYSLFYQNVGK